MKNKTLVHIIVFHMVTSDGDVMTPFIFSYGFTLNMKTYIKCLGGCPRGVMVKAMDCGI